MDSRNDQMQRSFASLRVCDFFRIAKNQRCKQYSYGDKMVEKSKKSQTLRMTTNFSLLKLTQSPIIDLARLLNLNHALCAGGFQLFNARHYIAGEGE